MGSKVVIGKLSMGTEENRDKALELFKGIAEFSLKNEPGVLKYFITIPKDESDKTSIYMYEEYADQAAIDAHFVTPGVTSLMQFLGSDPVISKPVVYRLDPATSFMRETTVPENATVLLASLTYETGTRAQAIQGWKQVTEAAESTESGTLGYHVLQNQEDENEIKILEIYESEGYLWDVHAKSAAIVEHQVKYGSIRTGLGHVMLKPVGGNGLAVRSVHCSAPRSPRVTTMPHDNEISIAMTNRSLRTIRTELEFLTDSSVITPAQLSSILDQLPKQTQLHAPLSHTPSDTPYTAPVNQLSVLSLNEKIPEPSPSPYSSPPPPPSYSSGPPILSIASALYAYTPTDAGDLALQPNDRVQVLEHMNNDWWSGRNERTNTEGIFPRTYVSVIEEKPIIHSPQPISYHNMPLEVAHSGQSSSQVDGKRPTKFEENGKKFGKKMGNAAIFGAGATIGSNIVKGIF
ncbi:hypothetical protein FQN57_006072 [Myotisia sp. PD_48]|nr:hypothetical protein FQN57_006072 [Myotisia sp. PD_48]